MVCSGGGGGGGVSKHCRDDLLWVLLLQGWKRLRALRGLPCRFFSEERYGCCAAHRGVKGLVCLLALAAHTHTAPHTQSVRIKSSTEWYTVMV